MSYKEYPANTENHAIVDIRKWIISSLVWSVLSSFVLIFLLFIIFLNKNKDNLKFSKLIYILIFISILILILSISSQGVIAEKIYHDIQPKD